MNDVDTMPLVWDAENDRFVRPLHCPHCAAPSPIVPDLAREAALCAFCGRAFELVKLIVGDGEGALALHVARRPQLAWCSTTGEPLHQPSLLEWSGANGGAGRVGAVVDPRGLLYGVPQRDVVWDLVLDWSQARFGREDPARADEVITSVSVWKGIVVVVCASGLVGLFDVDTGAPLLAHAIAWPGVDLEDDDHARAVRLPPALRATTLVLTTDRVVLVRDMAPALSVQGVVAGRLFTALPAPPTQQWIGAPLMAGTSTPTIVLLRGQVTANGIVDATIDIVFGDGARLGEVRASVAAPGIVRAPVWSPTTRRVVWVDAGGGVCSVDVDRIVDGVDVVVTSSAPRQPLVLAAQERALLIAVDGSADGRAADELWLADDTDGLRVWRAPLSRIVDGDAAWAWEPLLESRDIGALRGFAVAPASSTIASSSSRANQLYVVATERSTAAFTRALKSNASDSVLAREPVAPPVLTPLGYLSQDRHGLWLRAVPPWSFLDDNPERFLDPGVRETRPAFYDRTFAVVGRQVFFAHAGRVFCARLVPRRARVTVAPTPAAPSSSTPEDPAA
ncbi:MAG TPA: hypothetical protein VGF99_20075 [Myxococcota bacterium]